MLWNADYYVQNIGLTETGSPNGFLAFSKNVTVEIHYHASSSKAQLNTGSSVPF